MAITRWLFLLLLVAQSSFSKALDTRDPKSARAVQKLIRFLARSTDSPSVCNGRLTLTTATPITTGNVTGATTVYFTPFNGNKIALYSGSIWQLVAFTEKSVSVPATTTTPFDIFAYNNSGTLTLETVNWTNDTTRATALVAQDGVLSKTGAVTRRYLGTARTTSVSGQTEDSASRRLLWNMCNRSTRSILAQSATASWTISNGWGLANGDSTVGVTRVEFVLGQQVEPLRLVIYIPGVADAAAPLFAAVIIGVNTVSDISSDLYGFNTAVGGGGAQSIYRGTASIGFNYAQWLEYTDSGPPLGTRLWYGAGTGYQGGIRGEIWQ
jgi:hypothetical protein